MKQGTKEIYISLLDSVSEEEKEDSIIEIPETQPSSSTLKRRVSTTSSNKSQNLSII